MSVHNSQAEATTLLPASLPLEQKAVTQLLSFASVQHPENHYQVCKACSTPDFHLGSTAPVAHDSRNSR
ncbi:MAG: hypothetical protein ACH34X_08535 [Thiolinea sp.]